MTSPTFVKPSASHPISAALLDKPKNQYSGLNPVKPAIREGATDYPTVAPGVAELEALFAPSLTQQEQDWAAGKIPSSLQHDEPRTPPAPPKFRNAYHAIIDALLIDPTVTITRLSTLTGYSRTWLHKVMSSDSFQSQLAARRKNCVDDHIRETVTDRLAGLGSRALEILETALDSDKAPAAFALEVLNMTNKAQGIGQQKVQNVANFIVQVPVPMTNAADWAAQHNPAGALATPQPVTEPIDITPVDRPTQEDVQRRVGELLDAKTVETWGTVDVGDDGVGATDE